MPPAFTSNLDERTAPSLFASARERGPSLTALESRRSAEADFTPERIDALREQLRLGGSLLLTLDRDPGPGATRLASVLPTTAWATQIRTNTAARPIRAASWDTALFPHDEPRGLDLPWYFELRPVSAVERGQWRYERFRHPDDRPWSRPLLDRDWKARIQGSDLAATPLLLTGEYGAGRVAVLATNAAAIERSPNAEAFWRALLTWLAGTRPADSSSGSVSLSVEPAGRALRVTVTPPTAGKLIARVSTWEPAWITDIELDAAPTVTIPLPAISPESYQALDFRDAFDVRIGLLSPSGSNLLAETRTSLDLRPAVTIDVALASARKNAYPSLPFPASLGADIPSYAHPPGAETTVRVTLRNGLRNIAPLAQVKDETNPANRSTPMLNDEAMAAEKGPADGIEAYGAWTGRAGEENVLLFDFGRPATIAGVTLVGSFDNTRNRALHNPDAAIVEAEGKEIARLQSLQPAFLEQNGRVALKFVPVATSAVRVRLPRMERAPVLGEIEVLGWMDPAPEPASGALHVTLHDALSGETHDLGSREVHLARHESAELQIPFTLPARAPRFYRIEARFADRVASAPVLAIQPAHPLTPITDLVPPDAANLGFIVTRGFRNCFTTGTGTAEIHEGWGQPDDLVWAYSRQLKQIPRTARTDAKSLYVTESDFRHYSTPWRSFANGELLYDVATPNLVEAMRRHPGWSKSEVAVLAHSDRWDTGPQMSALHGWQDFVEFDAWLREKGAPPLTGKTRTEIADEIHGKREDEWQAWQLARYVHAVRDLREAFAKAGKRLVISAQGLPMVAGEAGAELALTIRGMSDDCTWGMAENSVPLTTGRQMGEMAFNPVWAMSTLLQWGYDSSVLNNPQWHAPVGTTEPSLRHAHDRAWRGVVRPDGAYGSVCAYGYNSNAGISYTMTENDWREYWRMAERHSLIAPEEPVGAGLVVSTSRHADPRHIRFSGGGETTEAAAEVMLTARVMRDLQEAGVSVPFAMNAAALTKWQGDAPLVLVNRENFSEEELAAVAKLAARGVVVTEPKNAVRDLAPHLPLTFPEGTAGYAFRMQGLTFVVIEEWREQGRRASLRVRARTGAKTARACEANDHSTLTVSRDGDWWVVDVPLRAAGAALVAIEEAA